VVLAGLWCVPALADAPADSVRQIENDTENVRAAVQLIDTDLAKAAAKDRRYPMEQRYMEATVAYERGNLPTAAVMLYDLVNNPQFQATNDYTQGLWMLGDALFRLHNYMGARRYLDPLSKQPANKYFQSALQELADIAVRLHRIEEVETYAKRLDAVPPGQRRSELVYQFGRAFFAGKKFDRARQLLEQVAVGDKRWPNAHFYLGALAVASGKTDAAIAEFRKVLESVASQPDDAKPEQAVLDYTNLALGRLFLQAKKYDDAAVHYGAVDRNSPVYEESLFELAATYVAGKKPKQAVEALDVLLLTVADDNVAVQAAVLRGRINMLAKQYDQADAAYQDVVERYSSITRELTGFAKDDKNLEQFFTWLLNRATEEYTVTRPVSERLSKYIEKDDDMQRVVGLFDEMAAERADVKETVKLAATIEAALKESNRLDMYPELKDAWLRLVENQNRAVSLGRRVLDLLRAQAEPLMTAEDRAAAEKARAQRAKWETAFGKVPATRGEYVGRQNAVTSRIVDLAGQVGMLKTRLEDVRQQVMAVEKMLTDRIYSNENVVLTKDKEAELKVKLQEERDEVRRLYREIEELNQESEVAAQAVGAGDKVSEDEATVRAGLAAAQRAEQELYMAVLERNNVGAGDISRLRAARGNLDQLAATMQGVLGNIGKRAGDRLANIRSELAKEQRNIAEYQVSVRSYEDDSRRLARDVGYGLIRSAERRLADIVLEADLGMVDVAWQRKQDKAQAIKELQQEKNAKIKSLNNVLESLTAPSSAEEP
jgi:tetratricopeptide (TPR) repeat protein